MTRASLHSATAKVAGFLAGCLLALAPFAAFAGVGVVTHLAGVLTVKKADGNTKILAAQSEVDEGDVLATGEKTFARIRFSDGGNLVIRPNSQIKIDQYRYTAEKPEDDNVAVSLVKGGLRSITGIVGKRSKERHTTTTANATIGIRGTNWGAITCSDDCGNYRTNEGNTPPPGLYVDILNGEIIVSNQGGSMNFGPGQFGYVSSPNAPPVLLPPGQGVLASVPPSMASDTGAGMTLGQGSNDNKCSAK